MMAGIITKSGIILCFKSKRKIIIKEEIIGIKARKLNHKLIFK
jgi:hypothetical protein